MSFFGWKSWKRLYKDKCMDAQYYRNLADELKERIKTLQRVWVKEMNRHAVTEQELNRKDGKLKRLLRMYGEVRAEKKYLKARVGILGGEVARLRKRTFSDVIEENEKLKVQNNQLRSENERLNNLAQTTGNIDFTRYDEIRNLKGEIGGLKDHCAGLETENRLLKNDRDYFKQDYLDVRQVLKDERSRHLNEKHKAYQEGYNACLKQMSEPERTRHRMVWEQQQGLKP